MSDRIAVINKGRIEQLGDASAIYHQPKTTFVANFIGQANILEATVQARLGRTAKVALKGGLELAVRADDLSDNASSVLISIRPEKILIRKARDASVENCFEAEVAEEIFRGATDQLLLRTASGLELTAVVANESSKRDAVHRGDHVYCHLHDDHVVIVQDA